MFTSKSNLFVLRRPKYPNHFVLKIRPGGFADYRDRLKQVWMNFISNAIKYTRAGYIRIGYATEKNGIRIYVEDSGLGIPEEMHQMVFNRFQKLDDFVQGTGLGLTISKAIVEAAGGEIGFTSAPGKGSTFWAWLPCTVEK